MAHSQSIVTRSWRTRPSDRLQAQVKNYEQEVSVLALLRDTLRTAESEAKTRYLAPVVMRRLMQKTRSSRQANLVPRVNHFERNS
jgi:hypothetical protein